MKKINILLKYFSIMTLITSTSIHSMNLGATEMATTVSAKVEHFNQYIDKKIFNFRDLCKTIKKKGR